MTLKNINRLLKMVGLVLVVVTEGDEPIKLWIERSSGFTRRTRKR